VHIASKSDLPDNPDNLSICFDKVSKQETENSKSLCNIISICNDEAERVTLNFLKGIVKVQVEGEIFSMGLIDKSAQNTFYDIDKNKVNNFRDVSMPNIRLENPNMVYKTEIYDLMG